MTRRLVTSWVALALLVLVALEVPLGLSYAHNQRSDALAKLQHDAVAVGALAAGALNGEGSAGIARAIARYGEETDGRVVVVDSHGNLVVGVSGTSDTDAHEALTGHSVRSTRDGELSAAVPVTTNSRIVGAVGIVTSISEVNEAINSFWWTLGGIGAAVLAVTALVAVLLSRSVTRPLRHLEGVAERVGSGELAARAGTDDGPAEVRALAKRFNETVAKLEQLVSTQEAFVADASHQLRTPLTALRLRLENGDLNGGLAEVDRMSEIVDALLALARAEVTAPEEVDLAQAVAQRINAWSEIASDGGIRLESSVRGQAFVGRSRFDQIIDNLLANAIAASSRGSSIAVRGDAGALHVEDQGPGMNAADRSRAFDRFWSKSGSSGLGLSIVKRLVEADGGSVELEPAETGGLDAVLHLRSVRP